MTIIEALPKKAQDRIDEIFGLYTEDPKLKEFHIVHLYDTGRLCMTDDSGYNDSRHMKVVIYNTTTMTKTELGVKDGIAAYDNAPRIDIIRTFMDGSTLIRFKSAAVIEFHGQCVVIKNTEPF